jgi:hypothetical protein
MEQPDQPGEPVRYVGGLTDAPRPPAWPYVVLSGILVLLVAGGILLWNPILSIGRRAGQTIAPYSLALTAARWSSDQKIVGVPVSISLTVDNVDQRTINGLTLRFTQIDPAWQVMGASSARFDGELSGTSIFFADVIPPGGSATLSVTLLPTRAMDSEIDVTLTPARSSTPARVTLVSGSVLTTLALGAKVRLPTVADAGARLTAIYDPQVPVGKAARWNIHVANTGPIEIMGIRFRLPANAQTYFDISYLPTQATVLPDGLTLEFATTLPPGGQTILIVQVIPKESGHFTIPIQVYLGASTLSLSAANGGPPLSIDLTVK